MKPEFFNEDDLDTFEGWCRYQAVDVATLTPGELTEWKAAFEETKSLSEATPTVGLMKLRPTPGEFRYAVAIRNESGLWLTLWTKRSAKGEFFVMIPRGDREWNPHASYHLDGKLHHKSYDRKSPLMQQQRQPLRGKFRGTEHLGSYGGHGTRMGAVCDPAVFNGVVEVARRAGASRWPSRDRPRGARL